MAPQGSRARRISFLPLLLASPASGFVSTFPATIYGTSGNALAACPAASASAGQTRLHVAHSSARARRGHVPPLRMSANPDTTEVASIIEQMESWIACITPDGHSKRHIRYTVSAGTTLPEVFADFWKAVSNSVDEHRATGENESFRLLHMVIAPFCMALEEYDTMQKVDQLFGQCAEEGACEEFGKPITILHYHPNFRNAPKPETSRTSVRHSPFPAFSLNVFYKAGGLMANTAAPPLPPVGRRAMPPGPLPPPQASQQSQSSEKRRRAGDGSEKGGGGADAASRPKASKSEKGDKDREWIIRTRTALEALYNRAAASSSNDRVDTHGAPQNDIPESSQAILEATQTWIRQVVAESQEEKNNEFPSTGLVRHMDNVAQVVVTRSKIAENVYADVWEAVVDLVKRAKDVGCDVAVGGGDGGESFCTSAVLAMPDFATFNAEQFKKFGQSINRGLRHLPMEDDISIQVFHPEFVSDTTDNHTFRRSPYPSMHICYHGLREPTGQAAVVTAATRNGMAAADGTASWGGGSSGAEASDAGSGI